MTTRTPIGSPALRLTGVSVAYADDAPALEDCSLEVALGERVALLGANGSGKTTLLLATVGLVPHAGEIHVEGVRLDPVHPDDVRQRIGFLFSNPEDQILFPRVLDDVGFALRLRGTPAPEADARALDILESLGAAHLAERSPYRLSRGQRLRVALAGAVVAAPTLLLLDEPTSGLDPAGRRSLVATLSRLPAAMLIATHDLDFARQCCNRFVLLEDGRVVAEGSRFESVAL